MKNLSTRSKLMLLVIVSALPALALTLYSAFEERALAKANARNELVRLGLWSRIGPEGYRPERFADEDR